MSKVRIKISGRVQHISGKGSRTINKILDEKILPVVMENITEQIREQAIENAKGAAVPAQKLPNQANHPIGGSDSGYSSSNVLADSIEVTDTHITKGGIFRSVITALVEYASWLEFGTGIFGPRGTPIKAKGKAMKFQYKGKTVFAKSIKGQPPQPFMRGAVWFVKDNMSQTINKINIMLRNKYGR